MHFPEKKSLYFSKGYFIQRMLRSTGIERDQYGDYMYLNAVFKKMFNVFKCKRF